MAGGNINRIDDGGGYPHHHAAPAPRRSSSSGAETFPNLPAFLTTADPLWDGWVEFLTRYPWHWFVTLTFRDDKHPESAFKAFMVFINAINQTLYGRNYLKRGEEGVMWAVGIEYQKRGVIHFHALLRETQDLNCLARRLDFVDWWWEKFGIARIESVANNQDVAGYVSKYVTKDGEIEVCKHLNKTTQFKLS